jgi:lysophospholipase L1-like esterase
MPKQIKNFAPKTDNQMNTSFTTRKKSLHFIERLAVAIVFGLLPAINFAQTADEKTNETARAMRTENFPANPNLPSLFLIGDSTVRNGSGTGTGGQWGWGEPIVALFDTNKINVVNRALGGTSSRTFYRDQWPRVLAMLKPGDFVLMQFGHNDGGAINETVLNAGTRSRGTIKGIGDGTQEITNIITKKFEVVHSFGWYEKQFIIEARSKGATPMVCSLIPRNTWRDGKAARNANDYGGWAGQAAKAENAPFIDINEILAGEYDRLGQEKVNTLFIAGAGPHTSLAGAQTNAVCVVAGIKGLKDNPLTAFLSDAGKGVAPADLSQSAAK